MKFYQLKFVAPMTWFAIGFFGMTVLWLCLSCKDESEAPDKTVSVFGVPKQQVEGARFAVERCGSFQAGYGNNVREILIITDSSTGKKYLAITGTGVTELHTEKSNNNTVTKEE